MLKMKTMCDLVFSWIVQQLRKDTRTLQELCDYVRRRLPV